MAKTFAQLKTLVGSYLDRSDLTSYTGDWVNSSIRKIEQANNYDRAMMSRATTTSNDEFVTGPTRFKETIYLKVKDANNIYHQLEKKSIQDMLLISQGTITGRPLYYSYNFPQGEFHVRPVPDTTYTYDIGYYAYSAELSADGDTNWWTNNAWEAVLYGALAEAEPFLINDGRITLWKELLTEYLQQIKQGETGERFKGITGNATCSVH